MAILECPSGTVEIRLRKSCSAEGEISYFDEFEKIQVVDSAANNRCTRYIIPEEITYAIEVTLKQGFYLGECEGVRIKLYDKASDGFIGQKLFPRGQLDYLESDKSNLIETVSGGIAEGKWIENAGLMFKRLAMDDSLDRETDVAGLPVANLGGLYIHVSKCSAKSEVAISKREFERQTARYEGRQVMSQAKNIDEVSFSKDGITHVIGLSGGSAGNQVRAPTQTQMLRKETDKLYFDFVCRSEEFLENNFFLKSPLPVEWQPWHQLTPGERDTAYKALQQQHSVVGNIAKSGRHPVADASKEGADWTAKSQERWRNMSETKRRSAFIALQHLRVEFEIQKQSTAIPIKAPLNELHKVLSSCEAPILQLPTLSTVHANPPVRSSTQKLRTPKSDIIDLDDSPPRKRRTVPIGHLRTLAGTHAEPIDLDTFVFRSESSTSKASHATPELAEPREYKRIKLDPFSDSHASDTASSVQMKYELELRTKEHGEAAKIARLYREAEEMKAEIEKLEEEKD